MKQFLLFAVIVLSFTAAAPAQVAEAAGKAASLQFPGVTPKQLQQLRSAKQSTPVVLPTWLPAGFKLARIEMKLDRRVPIYDRYLKITYEREMSGVTQRFYLEAGFDGLGGLPYDATKSLKTQIGTIDLMYQPNDEDGNKIKNYAITEWFNIGRTAFHYVETYEDEPDQPARKMLSLADTEKILRSLRRL